MMTPQKFVAALSSIELEGVFNPYRDRCDQYDLADGPAVRRRNLRSYLEAIRELGTDTLWMGRDLGYRGGRRTGLAFTDENNLSVLAASYPGARPSKATIGPVVAERTATEIWTLLQQLESPPMLWNVFPFHPHEVGEPLSNRRYKAKELNAVHEINRTLIDWLGISRIICVGRDAQKYASTLGVDVEVVRHPSYGGVVEFRQGIRKLYCLNDGDARPLEQVELFAQAL